MSELLSNIPRQSNIKRVELIFTRREKEETVWLEKFYNFIEHYKLFEFLILIYIKFLIPFTLLLLLYI